MLRLILFSLYIIYLKAWLVLLNIVIRILYDLVADLAGFDPSVTSQTQAGAPSSGGGAQGSHASLTSSGYNSLNKKAKGVCS